MLTIIIPSKTEVFLKKTVEDVLEKSTGDIEILVGLDGYEEKERVNDPRVKYFSMAPSNSNQKRQLVNQAVQMAKGEYIMSLDAHCMMAKGFDEQLIKDHQPNWVQIPRRNRLDAENWCIQDQPGRPPIDYEYIMWRPVVNKQGFHGYKWDSRTLERINIPIDDTMTIQGSCWFVQRDWFLKNNIFKDVGYTGWGQEGEEVAFTAWLTGGRVVTNKNTNFSHLHKGHKYGRMYHLNKSEALESYKYSYDFWINNRPLKGRIHNFDWLIEKFWPLPNWPSNWIEILYKDK